MEQNGLPSPREPLRAIPNVTKSWCQHNLSNTGYRRKDKIRQMTRVRDREIFCIFGFSESQNVKKMVMAKFQLAELQLAEYLK